MTSARKRRAPFSRLKRQFDQVQRAVNLATVADHFMAHTHSAPCNHVQEVGRDLCLRHSVEGGQWSERHAHHARPGVRAQDEGHRPDR